MSPVEIPAEIVDARLTCVALTEEILILLLSFTRVSLLVLTTPNTETGIISVQTPAAPVADAVVSVAVVASALLKSVS